MSVPGYIQKTLRLKPEVAKIFDDLDAWLDHCRFNMLKYDPADLYKSREYKEFQNGGRTPNRKFHKREHVKGKYERNPR